MTHQRFASNRMENLLEVLKDQLLSSKPFTPKIIVVPSNHVKDWVQRSLADDPACGVAMGVKFMGLMPAIEYLANQPVFLSESSLSLNLEGEINQILRSEECRSEIFAPLIAYVKPEKSTQYTQDRVRHLADHLARAFMKMNRYGGDFLQRWLKIRGWKQMLWQQTIKMQSYMQFSNLSPVKRMCEMHFFALSSIPDLYFRFIEKSLDPIHHYIFSPCQMFWGDILSDSGRLALLKKKQTMDLDSYLQDRNPLLANWAIKHTFKQIEEHPHTEIYQDANDGTLLEKIQHDILYSEKRSDFPMDKTLQIHAAPTKLREIEILKNGLIEHFVNKPLKPCDVLILAPNIAEYVPYIQKVFGDQCPFNFVIHDVPKLFDRAFLKALEGLMHLVKSRTSPQDVLDFFANPCVKKQCQISTEDLFLLEKWAKDCGVHWGLDHEDRDQLLALPEFEDPMLEKSDLGTWRYCFDGLLAGLAVIANEDEPCDLHPLDLVENSVAETLGKWICLIQSLQQSFEPMTLTDWKKRFSSFAMQFIDPSIDPGGYKLFADALEGLSCQNSYVLPFDSFWQRLKNSLETKTGTVHGNDLNAVPFCSMKTGRACPASLVWCLGLHDGAYPRLPTSNPLDEMGYSGDPCPSHADEDRHLFLELVLSARDTFCVSYLSNSDADGKPQGLSIVAQELLNYVHLDLAIYHPNQGFNPCYFSGNSDFNSYDKNAFSIAAMDEQKTAHLIPQFFTKAEKSRKIIPKDTHLSVEDIAAFARHPLAYFIKKRLGVYLEYEEEDGEFQLSSLHHFLAKKSLLHGVKGEVISSLQNSGMLPLGRFGELAGKRLQIHAENFKQKLEEFNVKKSDLFQIQLHKADVKQFYIGEKEVGLHALELTLSDGTGVSIHGNITDVSPEGLCVQSRADLSNQVKIWPLMLILGVLDVCKPQALFLEDGKKLEIDQTKAKEALQRYIEYFLRAQIDPSPFIPGWASAFLTKCPNDLKTSDLEDPYFKWAIGDDDRIDKAALFVRWQKDLQYVFEDLI